jgi:anti-sigma B factor antagonist
MSAGLRVAVTIGDGGATVRVAGELDLSTGPALARAVSQCRGSAPHVTLDLRELNFIDCAGLRAVLEADRQGPLTVIAGTGRARQLLRLTGTDRRLALAAAPLASRAA